MPKRKRSGSLIVDHDFRVVVCGGRNFADWKLLKHEINNIHKSVLWPPISRIIAGGASGADTLAINWAKKYKVPFQIFEADWTNLGKRAGILRNTQMITQGNPHLCIAFPGGRGTANMIAQCKMHLIQVIEIPHTTEPVNNDLQKVKD